MSIDGFILPKNPAKRSRPDPTINTNTHNKYSSLKEVILPDPKTKHDRVPPIYMQSKGHADNLSVCRKFISSFTLTYQSNGQVRVQTRTSTDFRALKKGLQEINTEFHSFSLQNEKPKKSIIKGLPLISIDEIKEDLSSQGFPPINVFLLKGKNGQPTRAPIFLVHLDPSTNMTNFKAINSVCHCKVTTEKYKTHGIGTQCFRCQLHGHAAANCNRASRCVKCAGDHPTASCTKMADTPAKCCNCGGSHTASFRDCPTRKQYLQTKMTPATKTTSVKKDVQPPRTFTTNHTNGRSWATVTKGVPNICPSEMPSVPSPPTSASNSADLPIGELMQLVLKVRELQQKLKTCPTKEERCYLIMELAATLENV